MPKEKEPEKDTILRFESEMSLTDMTKNRKIDQRILQCGTEGQYFCYISREWVEKLGLTKGSPVQLMLFNDHIAIYPMNDFLKLLAGTGFGNQSP